MIVSWVHVYGKVLNEKDTVTNFIQSEFKGLNHAVPPKVYIGGIFCLLF